MMKKGVVIGGGIAGLVSAALLAAKGYEMTLIEKEAEFGGKFRSRTLGPYSFDLGPSLVTMPWIFDQVFREAGQFMDPELRFTPLPVNSRHFFYNKTIFDLSADPDYMLEQLAQFSPEDRQGFLEFIDQAQRVYEAVEETILEQPFSRLSDLLGTANMKKWIKVPPLKPLHNYLRRFFDDPRLISIMNRYALYAGSSPYEAPAWLSLFAYLELVQGAAYIEGGNRQLVDSLVRLAETSGVILIPECEGEEILVDQGIVKGVRTKEHTFEADFVVSTVDVRTTKEKLLAPEWRSGRNKALSCSWFLWLIGTKERYPHLSHHNYFYPEQVGREYIDIFEQKKWPLAPVLYIGCPSVTEPARAAGGSNLCVMVHVPSETRPEEERKHLYEDFRKQLLFWLENGWGLQGISEAIEVEEMIGPDEWAAMTGAYQGSLNGAALHGIRGLRRPHHRDAKVQGLYYAGSTSYPGGGEAWAAVSGMHLAHLIQWDREKKLEEEAKSNAVSS